MKSILYLVVFKQWKAYVALMFTLMLTFLALYGIEQKMNAVFKMPIAVQDLDESHASKQLVKALAQNKFVSVQQLDKEDAFIEDQIKANISVLTFSIPKGFEDKLAHQSMRDAIQLYYRDDFVGAIAQEITSKTLYEQQIPYIVTKHINQHEKVERTS
ncbi:ABC transporter permease [Macrococcus capreoli]|uniref:ABC transporter permease n=1 Tax=Macrococcus capreoli TaxID=2982690 RepID=UPI003EE65907